MKQKKKFIHINHTNCCKVCGNVKLESILDLPGLPLTDTFCKSPMEDPYGEIDQSLLFCPCCTHAQLHTIVDSNILYNDKYHFRTSASTNAKKGVKGFIDYLKFLFPEKTYSSILDIGCNDLYLLKKLKSFSKKCFGIDPVWMGREHTVSDNAIQVFGKCFEDITTKELIDWSPDLVVCRHTLEHMAEPRQILQTLLNSTKDDTIFLFEVPALEALVEQQRFDHIFHQHLHYFSLSSFIYLLEAIGSSYIAHKWNYKDWGALLIAFKKKGISSIYFDEYKQIDMDSIKRNYELFQAQFHTAGYILESCKSKTIYGYGAAQMLPVIAYHLNNDLSCLTAILDDDLTKDDLSYWNLPVTIQRVDKAENIETATVFITAIDNMRPIMSKLLMLNPKQIISPLHIF